ncbi:DUF3017 domain-containing protein [Nocardioides sp. SYSU DS0663]|uniref:DUF3017 domain-containing protein n=1 Tax=Nocardioides sp. SYSU DS0663 TaxID=3416445 RepID=UPI003F4B41C9
MVDRGPGSGPEGAAESGDEPELPSEDEVAAEVAAELDQVEDRRYPRTIGGGFYLVVLLATTVGIGVVVAGDWRVGIRIVAGALLAASLVRAALPHRDAGMLAVRHRIVDVLVLVLVASALLFLAGTIPEQPV